MSELDKQIREAKGQEVQTTSPRTLSPADTFEYGLDYPEGNAREWTIYSYTKEAVLRYRVQSIEAILNDTSILVKLIQHHLKYQVPRLDLLEGYYLGNNNTIMNGPRRRDPLKADHRIRNAFASTVSDFLNSYVLSNPVKVQAWDDADQESAFIEQVDKFNQRNDIDSHNLEIGKDQNNLGRAFELLQRNENDEDKIYRLDPREVFMIYDRSVATKVIAACRYFKVNEFDPSAAMYQVELYTPDMIYRFKTANIATVSKLTLDEDQIEEHRFHGVPIVEYRSDRYRMSVYERVLPQIDAYDAAQSDTANYMTDFNDAILAITGRAEGLDNTNLLKRMIDMNILVLVPEDNHQGNAASPIKSEYLTKSYDVQGVESYKSRLRDDIFSFSSTPDLTDDSFSGNKSGEALKYKIFGLQQRRQDKEKFLAKGFRVRYKLLENLKREVREYTGEPVRLDFIFTPNLPKAYLEELQEFVASGGEISNETKLELLSFIDDVQAEKERLVAEQGEVSSSGFESWDLTHGEE